MNDSTSSSTNLRLSAPVGLLRRVLRRIELEKVRMAIRRSLTAWGAITFISCMGLAAAGVFFYREAVTSGLGEYLAQSWSLVGISPSLALSHWSDIMTSIGESLPVAGLAILVAALGLVLWSADKVVGFSRKWRTV